MRFSVLYMDCSLGKSVRFSSFVRVLLFAVAVFLFMGTIREAAGQDGRKAVQNSNGVSPFVVTATRDTTSVNQNRNSSFETGILPTDSTSRPNHPKIGIVLSGGSAKGIAHVGVLKVFEEEGIPVDIITGTSMGAIAGGLYALGYSAAQLELFVTDRDWQFVFTDAVRRSNQNIIGRVSEQGVLVSLPTEGTEIKIPSGVISGQEVMALLSEWTWPFQEVEDLSQLPIPFTALATALRTGEAFPLTNVSLPVALRASMSIPTLFAPVNLDGTLYVDGGLSRNIPAIDAIDLGADVLIGVDVSTPTDDLRLDQATLVDVMLHTATYQGMRSDIRQRALLDILIRPDISGLSLTDFSRSQEWIARGEAAARAALPRINRMLDSLHIPHRKRELSFPAMVAKQVDSLNVVGVNEFAERLVRKRLDISIPVEVTPQQVSEAVSRVYATGLFDLVTYYFSRSSDGKQVLTIRVSPKKTQDNVGLGIRYDSENAAQILFTLALRNRLSYGSITEFRVSVGRQNQVRASYLSSNGVESRLSLGVSLDYSNAPVRFFLPRKYANSILIDPNVPVLSLGLDVFSVGLWGGFAMAPNTVASFSIEADAVEVSKEVAAITTALIPTSDNLLSIQTGDHSVLVASFGVARDTFNNRSFPSEGMRLNVDAGVGLSNTEPSLGPSNSGNQPTFQFFRFDAQGFVSLNSVLSVFGRSVLSLGSGDALPISYYSFIGGVRPTTVLPGMFIPLYGLTSQARFGRKAFMSAVGIQWETKKDLFTRLLVNGGGTYDLLVDGENEFLGSEDYDLIREKAIFGFGLEMGLRTPLGPASLILSSSKLGAIPEMSLSVGYSF